MVLLMVMWSPCQSQSLLGRAVLYCAAKHFQAQALQDCQIGVSPSKHTVIVVPAKLEL
jgi:hypothetical protein